MNMKKQNSLLPAFLALSLAVLALILTKIVFDIHSSDIFISFILSLCVFFLAVATLFFFWVSYMTLADYILNKLKK